MPTFSRFISNLAKTGLLLLISTVTYAQPQPLILQGKLKNCSDKQMNILLRAVDGVVQTDTAYIKSDGSFYYKTYKCKHPQKASLSSPNFQLNNIMIAPGYDLTIIGDVTNTLMFHTTARITGKGTCVNNYFEKVIQTMLKNQDTSKLYRIDTAFRVQAHKKEFRLMDSVRKLSFAGCTEPYASAFNKMIDYNNQFTYYTGILHVANQNRFSDSTYLSFVQRYIPADLLQQPEKEEDYLVSPKYTTFISAYIPYLKRLKLSQNKYALKDIPDFELYTIAHSFKSELRNRLLYARYDYGLSIATSLRELDSAKKLYAPYAQYISKENNKLLNDLYSTNIQRFQTGKPGNMAPAFTLKDNNGYSHSLSDFKGKVVYIDFWASWCGPCRAETPSLKILYKEYKDNPNIHIMSIAVSDSKTNWLKALAEDGMEWMQLRDDTGKLAEDYNTNTIPRFAIINKQGKIVTINAPRPSEGKKLISLLEAEMLK